MAMREQNDGIVVLDGDCGRLPPILDAWVNSSAVYWFRPPFPATGMTLMVGSARADGWAAKVKMYCHPKRGLWRAYVPGRTFTVRSETRYKVVALDEHGMRHVCGEGILRVYDGSVPDVEEYTAKCLAAFPDGTVREVTVAEDEAGEPSFVVGNPVDGASASAGPIYAYNKASGFFHAVTAFFDEAGEPMLAVADEPSAGGFESYAKDSSGFYRRVECAEDDAGEMALQTGEVVA